MRKARYYLLILLLPLLVGLSGCGLPGLGSSGKDAIKVSSVSTTESQILANMIAELVEHETNEKVELVNNLGSSIVVQQSMMQGSSDISAGRYDGTEITATLKMKPTKDPVKAQEIVKTQFLKRYNQTWFPTYGFADTYAFMVSDATAKKYHLETISDLAKVGSKLSAGVDSSWLNRVGDGYPAFQKAYGFKFKKATPMQVGLVYDSLAAKKMDVVLGYSTDGRIKSYHLKVLKDDRQFFPPYNCSLVATNQILKAHPELKPLLSRLDGKIDLTTMQNLNYEVDNNLLEPSVVAHNFLVKHNYFRAGGAK
ncbi:osmoprotectant ABC transporter substrate-binding protein [Periweissella cryptocerci]|uniref:Osmoprotectant ABC transporter substrate-binding protein n=1 Tax=Periweissella cryptocerci TaxID=2506420 RepID=A0A4P6YUT1_9LACO|nr:osmoprotectant ABC transporter substrate-binding protein [Periweissella cryptocerci]QBO36554.1 osmoprotectant ABC transporter substrate-binding protein [Periweissella cryptocerci]